MKKLICVLSILVIAFSLSACSTDNEYEDSVQRAHNAVQAANSQYERAVQEYNDLKDQISRYNAAVDALGG